MLARWTLKNFKSFNGTQNLDLAPLTLLCGANSSGKSSVLQSMLLVKQTYEHSPLERVIALNGPLVQLGTFTDILNDLAVAQRASEVSLGWRIDQGESEDINNTNYIGTSRVQVSCLEFTFDASGPKGDTSTLELQPDLKNCHVSGLVFDDGEPHHVQLEVVRASGAGRRIQFDSSQLGDEATMRFRVTKADSEISESGPSHVSGKVFGAVISHFAPTAVIVRYDRNRRLAKLAALALWDSAGARRSKLPSIRLSPPVISILEKVLSPLTQTPRVADSVVRLLSQARENPTVENVQLSVRESPFSARNSIREAVANSEKEIAAAIYADLGADQTISVARVETLARVAAVNERFFRFLLRYLGPLRADPRPLYPLQALTSPTDVGPKGEQTAAVLHLNAKRKVDSIPSAAFEGEPTKAAPVSQTLAEAVADWLNYLGIADAFETSEKGKLGHELRVRTPGVAEFQDLTNVGVGVSQILPIVVTCLLAAPGSTIVIEQPELHLHPAVQARLADFFVAMTLVKKQCIIETHSEHLIERVRFRVVQDRSNMIHQNTKIYFFNKERGSTSIREVSVNRFGSIDDWPKDFFDQSQAANEQIVLMALERHKEEAQKAKS